MRLFIRSLLRSRANGKIFQSRRALSDRTPSSSFGVAFDIDGVLLRGNAPIGGAPKALGRLFDGHGDIGIPFVFLTNGGGVPESKRATELSRFLQVPISPLQVVQGHSPFRDLMRRFEDKLVVAVGKGEPASVMSEYGFKKVLSMDDYSSCFESIDPLAQFKTWEIKQMNNNCNTKDLLAKYDVLSERVQGVFILSDPVDWGRDIQVLCDILSTGGLPGSGKGHQPPIYFANDDLEYQSTFPSERLGMGAFRLALESIFNRVHNIPLDYTSFGKPNQLAFSTAENVLKQLKSDTTSNSPNNGDMEKSCHPFTTLYMIGDNPAVDIQGARKAGYPWFSILTRTGVFKGKQNHEQYPADLVVDTVEEAVDFILKKEQV